MKNTKKKSKKWIIWVIIALAAAAAVYFLRDRRSSTSQTAASNYETQTVKNGNVIVTSEGNGTVEAQDTVAVTADYAFTFEEVLIEDGDSVTEGDRIAKISDDSIDEQISSVSSQLSEENSSISDMSRSGSSTLTSPINGRVKRIYVHTGDELADVTDQYGGVILLSADERMKVTFTSTASLDPGDQVMVRIPDKDDSGETHEETGTVVASDGETYTATFSDGSQYDVGTAVRILKDDDDDDDSSRTQIGEGTIEVNAPYYVRASYGRASSISVSKGDYVYSGDTLLERSDYSYNADYTDAVTDRQDLIDQLTELKALKKDPYLYAPCSGIVSDLNMQEGTQSVKDAQLCRIVSSDHFWLRTQIDELDIDGVAAGQSATVVFDAFDDEEYEGTVEKISALGSNSGGVTTYEVTITMPGNERIRLGMSATATIIVDEADDVLTIPVEAVTSRDGKKYVTVLNADGTTQEKEVTLGLVNNTTAQVTDGLREGEEVVTGQAATVADTFQSMIETRGNNTPDQENVSAQ